MVPLSPGDNIILPRGIRMLAMSARYPGRSESNLRGYRAGMDGAPRMPLAVYSMGTTRYRYTIP